MSRLVKNKVATTALGAAKSASLQRALGRSSRSLHTHAWFAPFWSDHARWQRSIDRLFADADRPQHRGSDWHAQWHADRDRFRQMRDEFWKQWHEHHHDHHAQQATAASNPASAAPQAQARRVDIAQSAPAADAKAATAAAAEAGAAADPAVAAATAISPAAADAATVTASATSDSAAAASTASAAAAAQPAPAATQRTTTSNSVSHNSNHTSGNEAARAWWWGREHPARSAAWWTHHHAPRLSVDVAETADAFTVHADVPGVAKEDLKVNVLNGVLTISGERRAELKHDDSHGSGYRRVERSHGLARRSLRLPSDADVDKISAKHENGVLTVQIPKLPAQQPLGRNVTVA